LAGWATPAGGTRRQATRTRLIVLKIKSLFERAGRI
jgi:hypothetical protein